MAKLEKWDCSLNDLEAWEMGTLLRELGIGIAEVEHYSVEAMALSAVLLRRRTDPDVPMEAWKKIKWSQLNHLDTADPIGPS